MSNCHTYQQQIIELADGGSSNASLETHLASCETCTEFYRNNALLNQALNELPEQDASDELVAKTLAAVESFTVQQGPQFDHESEREVEPEGRTEVEGHSDNVEYLKKSEDKKRTAKRLAFASKWSASLAASIIFVSTVGLYFQGVFTTTNYFSSPEDEIFRMSEDSSAVFFKDDQQAAPVTADSVDEQRRFSSADDRLQSGATLGDASGERQQVVDWKAMNQAPPPSPPQPKLKPKSQSSREETRDRVDGNAELLRLDTDTSGRNRSVGNSVTTDAKPSVAFAGGDQDIQEIIVTGSYIKGTQLDAPLPVEMISMETQPTQAPSSSSTQILKEEKVSPGKVARFDRYQDSLKKEAIVEAEEETASAAKAPVRENNSDQVNKQALDFARELDRFKEKDNDSDQRRYAQISNQYLNNLRSLDDVEFQDPTGYWANTYQPGDRDMRWLGLRLQAWDRSLLQAITGQGLSLEENIEPNRQPFDYPQSAALATYVHADLNAIQGQTRMKLQVGIQASERQSGQRSIMNVGVVVDLRSADNVSNNTITKVRALLLSLLQAKQSGDNFSVTLISKTSIVTVQADEFRHGPLQVALETLLVDVPTEQTSATLNSVHDQLLKTNAWLKTVDDPSSSLGSSLTLLVTANTLDDEFENIEAFAHQQAVEGITLSTISLGEEARRDQLELLALAGQGHARALPTAEAQQLVDRELFASSRAVARAVRLRIRLANGVKLVNVLGSYRLDETRSQRVRDAEKSIDQRMSRNLGIVSDRGDDEEGIQIVIPNFYAGDTHVIMLDVVAESAGPVADVSVRYKDLLFLRNGLSQNALELPAGDPKLSSLEFNVQKNVLAFEYSESIRKASQLLRKGDDVAAVDVLQSMQALYRSLRLAIPAWNDDQELQRDEQLLTQSLALIQSDLLNINTQRFYIADALQYASWHKWQSEN